MCAADEARFRGVQARVFLRVGGGSGISMRGERREASIQPKTEIYRQTFAKIMNLFIVII